MAAVRSLSEAEAAAWAAEQGRKVARHGARTWEQIRPGFYQPVHLLGSVGEPDLSRPARACWGYRAVVPDGTRTDSRLVIHLLEDLAAYDEGALTTKRRATLRRAQRSGVRIVPLDDDTALRGDGYGVCLSAYARFGFARLPTHGEYVRRLAAQRIGDRSAALGAFSDDRLVGYILAHVIEGMAYGDDFHVSTEALRTNVSTALLFEMLQLLRRSGVAQRAWNSMVDQDNPGLEAFKTSMGYARTSLPTRVHLCPGAGVLLRRCRPAKYARLTGAFAAA